MSLFKTSYSKPTHANNVYADGKKQRKKKFKKQLEDSIIKKERNLFKAKKENTAD